MRFSKFLLSIMSSCFPLFVVMFFFKLAVAEMSSNEGAKKIGKKKEAEKLGAVKLLRLGGSNKLI